MAQIHVLSHVCIQHISQSQLGNYSPYELVFGRKPKLLINVETNLDIKIAGMFKDYHTLLTKRLDYLEKKFAEFQDEMFGTFEQGQRVFPI